MIKKDHEEIWYWYERMEEYRESGMGQKDYCQAFNVDYKKFCNMRYRIEYKRYTDPILYEKLIPIGRKYITSGAPSNKFARAHGVEIRQLSEITTHINYLDIIEEIKREKDKGEMKFIEVKNLPMSKEGYGFKTEEPEAEVVEKQNDLEIIIAKGVKVSISPNIDTMKVIKIIELLKDL